MRTRLAATTLIATFAMGPAPVLAKDSLEQEATLGAPESGATNTANNPLTPKITVNVQDYYTPSFTGRSIPTRTAFFFAA